MMFVDCPAYLDDDSARRCGLPAEVRCRFVMSSSDGPLEAAMIRCLSGHWFNGPIEFLTREGTREHGPGKAPRHTRPARRAVSAAERMPGQPEQEPSRPNTAPAHYLGRPARLWISAMSPHRGRTPLAAAWTQTAGEDQPSRPADTTQPEPSQAMREMAPALR